MSIFKQNLEERGIKDILLSIGNEGSFSSVYEVLKICGHRMAVIFKFSSVLCRKNVSCFY